MKKSIVLFLLITSMMYVSFGQTIHNYFQLPTNTFENWTGGTMPQPYYWYSFESAGCNLDGATCTAIRTAGMFNNHHAKVIGRNGSGYACQLYTIHKSVMGYELEVNGALSTGRAIIGSLSLSDDANYVYSQIYGTTGNRWAFHGRPDSISIWARFSFFQNTHPNAMMRVHIHGNVEYKDIASHTAATPQVGKIANSYCVMTNPATTPVNGLYKSGWKRYAFKFNYWDEDNHIISQPTVNNTPTPSYILASLSTNASANVGPNDSLAFDDIFCIYDKGLASLTINGEENNTIREYFNYYEYLTHELTINSGTKTYEYNDLICYNSANDVPQISATPKSSLILSMNVTQATLENPTASIKIIHNDSSYYEYKIHFSNLHPAVEANLNSSTGTYTACEGEEVTVTVSGAPSYQWSNGSTSATIHPTTSGNYIVTATNGHCTAYNEAYVTIHPLPNVIISGNTNICAGNSTVLTAGGASTYHWNYNEATTSAINVNASGTYTVTGTSSEGCSTTASVTVNVNPLPTLTIDGPSYLCSGTTDNLVVSGASTYSWSWSGGTATGSTLPITTGGTYSVTGTNAQGCTSSTSFTVENRTTPSVIINGPSQLCAGTSGTLTATSPQPGTTFTWADNTTEPTLNISTGGTYSVTALLNGCENTAEKTVELLPTPDDPTVTPGSHCGSGQVTLTATPPAGSTCYWYASLNSPDQLATGNSFSTPTLTTSGTYYVQAQNSHGCISNRIPVAATIIPLPGAPTVSDISSCGASDIVLSDDSSIHWYSDEDGENEIPAAQHITATTTFYAAVFENGCRSLLSPKTVTINPIPSAPSVTDPAPACSNGNVDIPLSATPGNNGNSIRWYNNSMSLVSSNADYTVRNVSSSTVYYATTYNTTTHCESEKVPVNITKNNLPAAPALSSDPRCGAGEVTLHGDANGLIIKWYDANNNFLEEGNNYTTNLTTSTLFQATAYNAATTCESSPSSITAVVNPTYTGITDNQIACVSYTWEGTTYTQSGSYTKTLTSSKGCDSTVTLHLTLNDAYNISFDTTVCSQFVWDGSTYNTSGTYTKQYTSITNCDSNVTCHLTVNRPTSGSATLTLCPSQLPYDYNGTTITASGTTIIQLTNAAGCDSTLTLTVIVNPQPGIPTVTNRSSCGPKSLTLVSNYGSNSTTCHWYTTPEGGTSFHAGNSWEAYFTGDTTFYVSSYNDNTGCESDRTPVQVTINPVPGVPTVTDAARCGAGEVTLTATVGANGTLCRWFSNPTTTDILTTGESYTVTTSNNKSFFVESYNEATGCTSARVTTVATVNPIPSVPQVTANVSNCGPLSADLATYVSGGTLYRWYDNDETFLAENAHYTTTVNTTTTFLISNYNSTTDCESSKSALTITINPTYAPQNIFDTICQNTHYQNHGIEQDFDQAGDFTFNLSQSSSASCDSVVTLYVHVKPQIVHALTVTACNEYVWNDTTYTESGDYINTYTATNGCDSIDILHLTIHPSTSSQFTEQACDSYTWNNETYTTSGDYVQHFDNVHGCDSTVTLHLTIFESKETSIVVDTCDSYTWNNETYTESGEYTQSFFTSHHCDSTVTLHLTIHPSYNIELHEDICFNESYVFNGQPLTQSGTYTALLKSANHCDSIVTLHLNVYPEKRDTITAEVCLNDSYNEYGFHIPQATETQYFAHTHSDVNGCDSTTVLHLIVNQPAVTTFNATICLGGHYTENGFDFTATQTGTFTESQSLHTIKGCDSTVTLNITVNPAYQSSMSEDICQGETYIFHGKVLTETGIYADTLTTDLGCDSIVTLTLTVHQPVTTNFNATLCVGESYTSHGFSFTATEEGIFTQTQALHTTFGCDSTVTLTIIVNPTHTTSLTDDICVGETYTDYGFNITEMQPGTFNHSLSLHNQFGCDSTVTLVLNVHPNKQVVLNDQVCAGEPYQNNGFDTIFRRAGTYTLIHRDQTVFGCDSTTTLTVVVNPIRQNHIYENICFNESYSFHGKSISASGIYTDTLSTLLGCDSIVTLHLTVYPEKRDTIEAQTCVGIDYHGYDFDIVNPQETSFTSHTHTDVNGCDSTTVLHLVVHPNVITNLTDTTCQFEPYNKNGFSIPTDVAGTFTHTQKKQTSFGCDSTVNLQITIHPTHAFSYEADACIAVPFSAYGFDTVINNIGTFTLIHSYQNIYGCDSTITLDVTVHPNYIRSLSATICANETYDFHGRTLTQSGTYLDTLPTQFGCDSVISLTLTVRPEKRDTVEAYTCMGVPYDGYDFHVETTTESGYYSHHSTAADGCDSTTVLHLTVYEHKTTNLEATICQGGTYTENGFNIVGMNAGDSVYTRHLYTRFGCDSIVNLLLTVLPTNDIELYDEVCAGTAYHGYGFDTLITQAGTYLLEHFNQNIYGCDSSTTLTLTVNPTYRVNISSTICESGSYNFNGEILTQDGVYMITIPSSHGCDSTVTLMLHVAQEYRDTITAHICEGESYIQYGFSFMDPEPGEYFAEQHSTSHDLCDSTVILHLFVHQLSTTYVYDTICLGERYRKYGINTVPVSPGNYPYQNTYSTPYGCDSTIYVYLTVNPTHYIEYQEDICINRNYSGHGFDTTFSEVGTYRLEHFTQNIYGCDSTTVMILNVHPEYHQTIDAAICYNEVYHFDGNDYTESGTHVFNHHTVYGCDSTITLNLTVYPEKRDTLEAHICLGESYEDNGFIILHPTGTGYHEIVSSDVNGCDSTTVLHLYVHPQKLISFYDTICQYGYYNQHGFEIQANEAGNHTYINEGQTSFYCDSIVTLYLTVLPLHDLYFQASICAGEVFNEYGFNTIFTQAGEYTLYHDDVNQYGCDSTTTVQVSVHPVYSQEISASICFNKSYNFHGRVLTTPGIYTDTLHSIYGCDSIVTLTLDVYPERRDTIEANICLGDSYLENGFAIYTPEESGYYSQVSRDANGCDSTTILHLYVHPHKDTAFVRTLCLGESYTENGFDVHASVVGTFTYTQSLYTTSGCDSMVTLQVTVNPTSQVTLYDTICSGTAYQRNGFDTLIHQAGRHVLTHHDANVYQCDSTTTLNLLVRPSYHQNISKMICENSSYYFNGEELTEAGTYVAELTTVEGCDSIVTLVLSIGAEYRDTLTDHICANESYYRNGFELNQPLETGFYTLNLQAQNECDSVVVLHLTVFDIDATEIEATACDSYTWNNVTYHETGVYTQAFNNHNGCDSTVTLHLTVNYAEAIAFDTVVCNSFTWNDSVYTTSGDYDQSFKNKNGCDSIVTVHLTVNYAETFAFDTTVCDSYTWNDSVYTISGDYVQLFSNRNGCDSTVTLHLTINYTDISTFDTTVCDSFTWNDAVYTTSNDYTQHFINRNGCDSTVTVHLTVNHAETSAFDTVACDSFAWNDSVYTTSGDYMQSFTNRNGCDSTVTMHLTLHYAEASAFDTVVCDSFTWNDAVYTTSGDYPQVFTNRNGCDSTVTLHLTVNHAQFSQFSVTTCDSYTWNDSTYTTSGDYDQVFTDINGCDSTVTLHLTIHSSIATDDSVTICDSELPYTYGDTVFAVGTPAFSTTVFNLQTVNGCDSIATLHLTINPTVVTDTSVEVCDVELPYLWDGDEYWTTDVYDIHYPTVEGCDSLVRLHLNVHPTYNRDTMVTVCNGMLPYEFCTGHTFNAAGEYTITLQTVNGCDSVWNLELNVTPNTIHTAAQTVCDNELPVLFMGESFDHAGTFDIAETDLDGCVTITHFTLTVNETYHGYDALTVCQEELPVFYGDSVLTTAGAHDVHFSAANLCDSLVTVTLNIIPTAQGTETQHVCTNDFPFSYGGQTFNTEGVYTVTFNREGLCDSVVTLTLIEAQEYSFTETAEVCDHTLPYFWRGGEYNQSGVYYDSLTSFFGCDSVFVLSLTVNETQVVVSDPIVLCDGESETWHGMTLSEAGVYRDTMLNDITGCRVIHEVIVIVNPTYLFQETVTVCSDELPYEWRGLTLNEAGTREVYLQTVNTFCDSIYRLTLTVNPSYHATENAAVCDYDLPYLWHGQVITAAGSYFDTLQTANGCDSTFVLNLTVNPSQHIVTTDTVCDGNLPYSWRGFNLSASGHYFDTVQNAFGCQDIFELALTVNSSDVVTLRDTVCEGSYYSNYGFDTLAAQAGTLYLHQYLNNSLGCDSTVNLILTVLPAFLSETYGETCQNSPYEWRGFVFDTEGTYYDSLVAANGCDSVYVLHLTVNPTYDIYVNDTAMREHEYTYGSFVITPADSGTYEYDIQYYTLAGCDSIIHLTLYVQYNDGIEEHVMLPDFKFFPNPTTTVLNINGDRMKQVFVYDLNGKLVRKVNADSPESMQIDVTGFATGHYVVKVMLDDGQSVTRKIVVKRW